MNHEEMLELLKNEPDEFLDRYQPLSELSDGALKRVQDAVANELASRQLPFYEQVMEDPIGYTERVTNPTPFDTDDDYKRYLKSRASQDPDFFERSDDHDF